MSKSCFFIVCRHQLVIRVSVATNRVLFPTFRFITSGCMTVHVLIYRTHRFLIASGISLCGILWVCFLLYSSSPFLLNPLHPYHRQAKVFVKSYSRHASRHEVGSSYSPSSYAIFFICFSSALPPSLGNRCSGCSGLAYHPHTRTVHLFLSAFVPLYNSFVTQTLFFTRWKRLTGL